MMWATMSSGKIGFIAPGMFVAGLRLMPTTIIAFLSLLHDSNRTAKICRIHRREDRPDTLGALIKVSLGVHHIAAQRGGQAAGHAGGIVESSYRTNDEHD